MLQNRCLRSLHLCGLMCCAALTMGPKGRATPTQTAKRPFTVADDIGQMSLGSPRYSIGGPSHGLVAQYSPDGRQFVVVLRRGVASDNTNRYFMLLWQFVAFHWEGP